MHLIRNSLKYIPSRDYKAFTAQLKRVYAAPSLTAARSEFERFKQEWSRYQGAVAGWERSWPHVEQLFDVGSAVRRVMYTTNALESVNSSLRIVTRKGAFPTENALLKPLYLRVRELSKKWGQRPIPNWALVRNQLETDDNIRRRIQKYDF